MSPKTDLVPNKYKDMLFDYTDSCAENILRLQDIWEDCGIESDQLDDRMRKLFVWFQERWNNIIEDELIEVDTKRERVKQALVELQGLSQELEIEIPSKPDGLNLQQQLCWVDKTQSVVHQVKTQRLQKIDELIFAQKFLLDQMSDLRAFTLPENKRLPSERDIREFSSHVAMATDERRIRFDKLAPILEEACHLMESMGKVPHLKIEEKMQSLPIENWDLAYGNIQLAEETLRSLKVEEQQLHSRFAALRNQLDHLFDRLEVSPVERKELIQDLTEKTYQSVRRLEELVDEYEQLKRANMARFVEKLVEEAKHWTKALRTGEAFQELPGEPTDDLVDAYEKKISDLKNRHNQLTALFKLLEERDNLLSMLHELEEAQKDPNRYKNRGGALLQETKKRERVNKNLPIVMKQITKFLDSHETEFGVLIIDGKVLREEIAAFEEKRSRHNMTSTPLRNGRMTPSTPATAGRSQSQMTMRSAALKRAGTYTEMKPKSSLRTTPLSKAPNTVGKVYTRHMTLKSPRSTQKAKLTATKNALRRSTSYGDFESMLCTNDRQSTRILQPSNGRASKMTTRKLMF